MKWTLWLMVLFTTTVALTPHSLHAADPRHGVVMDLQQIENRGDDESQVTKKKRKLGNLLGGMAGLGVMASGKGGTVGSMAAAGAADAGEYAATKIGDQGPTTRYMVKVKLDSGKTLAITQLREQVEGIEVGSRVRVEGRGDSALIYAE